MKAFGELKRVFGVLILGTALVGCAGTPVGWEKTKSHGAIYSEGMCFPNNDSDKDGVVDSLDQCPSTPLGRIVDAKGCEIVESTPLEGVNFAYRSSELTPEAKLILDQVAKTLVNSNQSFLIEGHTDSVASESYNLKLSKMRAQAVLNYFKSKGIDEARMTAEGFGESMPLESNSTAAGRDKNRRVQLTVQK